MTTRIPVDKHRAWQVVRSAVYVCGESLKSCYYPIICAEDLRSRARVLPCNYILVIKKKKKAKHAALVESDHLSLSLCQVSLSFSFVCVFHAVFLASWPLLHAVHFRTSFSDKSSTTTLPRHCFSLRVFLVTRATETSLLK